jgi:serine/threonine protein kinase
VLEKIVTFPDQLHRNDRDWLMANTAWPWAVVEENGVVRGFLMRAVPDIYFFNFLTVTQGSKSMLSTVEFLLNPDSYVSRSGISISDKDRLILLATLGDAMSRLHALGIVIGDVSPKNLLFNLKSYSSCFFIDCDTISLHGESALQQVDTPEWEVPAGEARGTEASDSYKFGLLATRLFARDQDSRDASAITALSPELGRLAQRSQSSDPLNRPGPGSWVGAIQSAAASASSAGANQAYPGFAPHQAPTATHRFGAPGAVRPPADSPVRAPVAPAPRPRSNAKPLSLVGGGVAVLAIIAVIIAANVSRNSGNSGTLSSGSSPVSSAGPVGAPSGASSSQAAPSAQPSSVGSVGISDNVAGDSAATTVAGMFNTYFTRINSHIYQQAASVFDPSGIINPNDSSQVQQFAKGISTTSDSNMTLVDVDPSDGSAVQTAEMQFTSNQQAGYGPKDDPDETCTQWDVTYNLTQGSSGNYLIHSVASASDSGC